MIEQEGDEAPAKEGKRRSRHTGPLVYSVEEACNLLQVSTRHGYNMVRSGELPSLRLGHRILVPRAALEELIELAARTNGLIGAHAPARPPAPRAK